MYPRPALEIFHTSVDVAIALLSVDAEGAIGVELDSLARE